MDKNCEQPKDRCIHCGVQTEDKFGDVFICDDCYFVRGACCTEFEPEDE